MFKGNFLRQQVITYTPATTGMQVSCGKGFPTLNYPHSPLYI